MTIGTPPASGYWIVNWMAALLVLGAIVAIIVWRLP